MDLASPAHFMALRVTFLKRSTLPADKVPKDQQMMVYPGDGVIADRFERAGDHIKLTNAAMKDGPLPTGDWFTFAANWHQHPAGSIHSSNVTAEQRELMYNFISLGEDCEFSFIQRRAGAEPLEMFRFTGTSINQLITGFDEEFAAADDPAQIYFDVLPTKEMWCVNRKYGFRQHIFKNPSDLDLPAFKAEQSLRLRFLKRKLFEDIAAGDKALIYKRREGVSQDSVIKLNTAIRKWGAAPLLWITKCADGEAPGVITNLGDGLFKTAIPNFAPEGKAALGNLKDWIKICEIAKQTILP